MTKRVEATALKVAVCVCVCVCVCVSKRLPNRYPISLRVYTAAHRVIPDSRINRAISLG